MNVGNFLVTISERINRIARTIKFARGGGGGGGGEGLNVIKVSERGNVTYESKTRTL